MSETIPVEELETARRTFARRIGALIATAMAETDTSFETIDARLRLAKGATRQRMLALLDCGDSIRIDDVSDIFLAMGLVVNVDLRRRAPAKADEPTDD